MGGAIESTPPQKTSDSAKSKVDPNKAADAKAKIASFPRQRSRGQLARRNSITRGNDGLKDRKRSERRRQAALKGARHAASPTSFRDGFKEERPLIGALFFTDIIFIAFTYLFNLLRTCGLAELADVAAKGLFYAITQLPSDLYQRWTLSTPPAVVLSDRADRKSRRRRNRKQKKIQVQFAGSSSDSEGSEMQHQPVAFTSSHQPEPTQTLSGSPDQLSPFHHLVILLVRFACSNFPHLVPRVLFAEETIGPFVYWRTGGGSNAMVQEFSDLQERQLPVLQMGGKPHRSLAAEQPQDEQKLIEPAFRAYLISKDARLPLEVQRTNLASRSATTLFYLHGGGFSLGSVAFYAEALLRLRAKICALEAAEGNDNVVAEARCVAVEYDLSPAARFPTPLLQCLRCYAHLIEVEKIDPESICIAGDSAGGNLAMGLLLCLDGQMKGEKMLSERDWSKLPMPGKALLISPWVDLRPHHAHSFCDLRGEKDVKSSLQSEGERGKVSESDEKMQGWTDAVAAFDWDYVASEALLHFAQVYTGVLPSPRRVRGPVGWFAHVCSVLATEYNETSEAKGSTTSYGNGAFSSVIGPSRRVAQATHDLLSDPFLFSVLGLKDVDFLSDIEESQAMSTSMGDPTSSFAPLFTPSDRKTDSVASKKQLYEPIVKRDEAKVSFSGEEAARREAEELLDTHPLISPIVGDWRRIKLKGGCLVTWGERERMAEDIESWVQAVHRDIESERNAPPAQDGENHQPRPSHISFDDYGEDDDCWIETAVERGPGGVHAWPFVSMYLAGTEAERQRGLDLLADFVARSPVEQSASSIVEHASIAAPLPDRDAPTSMTDPPHAAPDSPISETGSVGSMPSDVDLHGLVDEDDDDNRFFQGPGSAIDIGEAVRIAHEIRSRDTSADEASHGLGLSNDVDNPRPTMSSPKAVTKTTPKKMSKPVIKTDLHHPHQQHQVKHAPVKAKFVGSTTRQSATSAARHIVEKERGRSRSPRRAGNLTANSSMTTSASSASSSGSAASSTENLPHFISSVRLHRPAAMQAQLIHEAVELPRGRQNPSQAVSPLWWTSSAKDETSETAPATTSAIHDAHTRETESSSEASKGKQKEQRSSDARIDDTQDEIAPVVSPKESLSPPSQNEEVAEEIQSKDASVAAPMDISFFGLSPYAIRRPEPEGLSDIAEEGSVMSGSITSAGEGGGFASRSLSPEDRHHRGDGESPPQTSLAAASLLLRDQMRARDGSKPRWPIEDDDVETMQGPTKEGGRPSPDEHKTREGGRHAASQSAHPGQSIPTTRLTKDIKGSDAIRQSINSSKDGTSPKKPKGDVWW